MEYTESVYLAKSEMVRSVIEQKKQMQLFSTHPLYTVSPSLYSVTLSI